MEKPSKQHAKGKPASLNLQNLVFTPLHSDFIPREPGESEIPNSSCRAVWNFFLSAAAGLVIFIRMDYIIRTETTYQEKK